MNSDSRVRVSVIGTQIDVLDWDEAIGRISAWAQARVSRYVCICNVHSVVLAAQDSEFRNTLETADMATPDGLRDIAAYAAFIGVDTSMIEPRDDSSTPLPPTPLIADAHSAGLRVVAWTFRAENLFLPLNYRLGDIATPDYGARHGDLAGWIARFYALGLDGAFSDFPAIAVAARP